MEEEYAPVHPAGRPAPRMLPLVDRAERCTSYTRDRWAAQERIPRATVEAEDDSGALDGVPSSRHGDHAGALTRRSTGRGRDHGSRAGAADAFGRLCHHP
ncbi:hypothetical protein GA0115254_117730 [Streptomyces sp. Ncost-T10-10d]|nr:hypothetical protein GA0115254_117730 [Streptomyces sp. Ncost-T10-10d]